MTPYFSKVVAKPSQPPLLFILCSILFQYTIVLVNWHSHSWHCMWWLSLALWSFIKYIRQIKKMDSENNGRNLLGFHQKTSMIAGSKIYVITCLTNTVAITHVWRSSPQTLSSKGDYRLHQYENSISFRLSLLNKKRIIKLHSIRCGCKSHETLKPIS